MPVFEIEWSLCTGYLGESLILSRGCLTNRKKSPFQCWCDGDQLKYPNSNFTFRLPFYIFGVKVVLEWETFFFFLLLSHSDKSLTKLTCTSNNLWGKNTWEEKQRCWTANACVSERERSHFTNRSCKDPAAKIRLKPETSKAFPHLMRPLEKRLIPQGCKAILSI